LRTNQETWNFGAIWIDRYIESLSGQEFNGEISQPDQARFEIKPVLVLLRLTQYIPRQAIEGVTIVPFTTGDFESVDAEVVM